ncbi:MAG: AraC family transcriptional regulator [Clostridiales bacterium]|nr:AraC family transcriptional regulator [Clostridiales bacterium]
MNGASAANERRTAAAAAANSAAITDGTTECLAAATDAANSAAVASTTAVTTAAPAALVAPTDTAVVSGVGEGSAAATGIADAHVPCAGECPTAAAGIAIADSACRIAVYDWRGGVERRRADGGDRRRPGRGDRRGENGGEGTRPQMKVAETPSQYGTALAYPVDEENRVDAAVIAKKAYAYGEKIRNSDGCNGICVLFDTGACDGKRCGNCEACASGLCAKRYIINGEHANILDRDGGDYRNLAANFIRRQRHEDAFDEQIRDRLNVDAIKAEAFVDSIRRQVVSADDFNLVYAWKDYTVDDFLRKFPQIDRRPTRVEMQILLYLFRNYRYAIDLEHVALRFSIPKQTINRYIRVGFGMSYTRLLAKIRNEQSKLLLKIPLLRIGEVGTLVGYKSEIHYSLNFKRGEGIPPKEFRRAATATSVNALAAD